MKFTAELYHINNLYDVTFEGELVLENARDPE